MITESFWTHDYTTGIQALLAFLKACNLENQQFIQLIQKRVEYEAKMGFELAKIFQDQESSTYKFQDQTIGRETTLQYGINRLVTELSVEAIARQKNAQQLDQTINKKIKDWSDGYSMKLIKFRAELTALMDNYTKALQQCTKCKQIYVEGCRKLEDAKFEGSPADAVVETLKAWKSSWTVAPTSPPKMPQKYYIAGLEYSKYELADLFKRIMEFITPQDFKIPLFRTYENCISGSMLAGSARKQLKNDSMAYAQKFGQSLVDYQFLKPVGQLSNNYEISHDRNYQLTSAFYDLIYSQFSDEECRSMSPVEMSTPQHQVPSSPISVASSKSTNSIASDPSEENYIRAVMELDELRCTTEDEIYRIYTQINELELDRCRIIKECMTGYTEIVYGKQHIAEGYMRIQTSQAELDPLADLKKLIKRYETGPFVPNVMVFRGYFDSTVVQTFGVDLSLSNFFVDIMMDWLENHRSAATKIRCWTHDEPLSEVHKVRAQINTGKPFNAEQVFSFFSPNLVVSTFLLYFLELPESLIPFTVYETVKTLLATNDNPSSDKLANVLFHIPQENRQIIFRLFTFLRTQIDESHYPELAFALSAKLMRPRAPSALSMHDTHPAQFLLLLLAKCPQVFSTLAVLQNEMQVRKNSRQVSYSDKSMRLDQHQDSISQDTFTPTKPERTISESQLKTLNLNSPNIGDVSNVKGFKIPQLSCPSTPNLNNSVNSEASSPPQSPNTSDASVNSRRSSQIQYSPIRRAAPRNQTVMKGLNLPRIG